MYSSLPLPFILLVSLMPRDGWRSNLAVPLVPHSFTDTPPFPAHLHLLVPTLPRTVTLCPSSTTCLPLPCSCLYTTVPHTTTYYSAMPSASQFPKAFLPLPLPFPVGSLPTGRTVYVLCSIHYLFIQKFHVPIHSIQFISIHYSFHSFIIPFHNLFIISFSFH